MVSSWKVAKSIMDIIPNSINWLGAARTDITIRIRQRILGQQDFRHSGKLLWFLLRQSLQTRILNLGQNGFLGSS